MRRDDPFDEIGEMLAGLSVHDTDEELAARIRGRCVDRLRSTRRQRDSRTRGPAAWAAWLEPAAALAISAVYLLSATATAIRLWRQ